MDKIICDTSDIGDIGDIPPGKIIRVMEPELKQDDNSNTTLDYQGGIVKINVDNSKWDKYFLTICNAVGSKSPCLSRQVGAILVRDHSIISTGYNGPARGIPHCGIERYRVDAEIQDLFKDFNPTDIDETCPRQLLGYTSGTHLEICPAQHSEENVISNAARNGVSTIGTTLYINFVLPCKDCFSTLINAGIKEIVVAKYTLYDSYKYIISNSNIKIREFQL